MWCVFTGPVNLSELGSVVLKDKNTLFPWNHETRTLWGFLWKGDYIITDICFKSYCLFNDRGSLHTRGSGDPSSGCICNTAGSDFSAIKSYPESNTSCVFFSSVGAWAESRTYHRLNNGDIDQASAAGSGHRNGLLRRHSQFNHTSVSSSLS